MRRAALWVGHVSIAYGAEKVDAASRRGARLRFRPRGVGLARRTAAMLTTTAADPPGPVPVTILIVEDDEDTSEFFADLLDFAGYQTHVAASGTAALAAFPQ
jgi:hypothetical protein